MNHPNIETNIVLWATISPLEGLKGTYIYREPVEENSCSLVLFYYKVLFQNPKGPLKSLGRVTKCQRFKILEIIDFPEVTFSFYDKPIFMLSAIA